ncbi:1,4-dihydroxy-2-naphthoate prenyltransferase [Salsuginibacillus halophilus]|uniref:1,4-dihydroxy-2-naphthoate octaprenyltransferase n=1 Tax=Salsuginibacillus halophilus TaxID=517424 RepID=A0A2P8HWB6_9BACI|nr:1,4-dihydroxy-2-naphthoate polyprenyltransferase [Salsuginibacillus halophilus]PSL50516.1 1,4-dihydroxy-2-naphthoate prenyltransferase [Salsuginibacillus halophilus]
MTSSTNVKQALGEKEGWQIWWRMIRPHTLSASFIPVFVGTAAASAETSIHFGLFFAMLLASLLIQAATNMFNEYYDYVRGLDTEHSVGIGGTIVRDGFSPAKVRNLAFLLYGIALLLGLYICLTTSFWVAAIGVISMLFGYLYTGGPYPIAYSPLGELTAGFFMGTVIIGISFFIQLETINAAIVYISLPVALLIGAILMANNIRDLDGDKLNGRKTLAILAGKQGAIVILTLFFGAAYVITAALAFTGIVPLWALLTLISIPKAIQAVKTFQTSHTPLEMMPGMKYTADTNKRFGWMYGFAFILEHLLPTTMM